MKAIACQLPSERGLPLSRFSSAEIAREAVARGIVEQVSGATVWRWLAEDAIRPWNYRSWIFPRDPDFRAKAARVLDLYAGRFEGKLLAPGRVRALRRREAVDPSAGPPASDGGAAPRRRRPAGRARVRADGRALLPGRLGRPAGEAVRPLRAEGRHRTVRPARRAGDDPGALRLRPARLLDRRQRLLPPRPALDRAARGPLPRTSSSSTCQSTPAGSTKSRSTSRSSSARCSSPTTSATSPPSKNGCSPSDATTSRSRSRSNGSSPETTSTACSNGSTRPAARPRSPRDGTCERNH